ncbi:MAG: 5-formyltetrahydrofolate cyclo-ligase [candidate division NC10 bacterium]
MQRKAELRQRMRAARQALLPADRAARSARIAERLFALPEMQEAERVLFYASLAEEVDTWPLLRAWLKRGRLPFLPGVERRGGPLRAAPVRDLVADLKPGAFGILQPDPSRTGAVEWRTIQVAVLPGLAFDLRGCRLGRGAGYYDRSLPALVAAARRIGLAFECQVVERLPAEPHDVPVDRVVTEDRIITPRRPGGV